MKLDRHWLWRVFGFLSRRRDVNGLDDELRFHLAMAEERFRGRGMSPSDARRAARIELGGLAQMREAYADQQTLPIMEQLIQDARHSLRAFLRAPGFTAAAVLTIAIGIGANVAIFSVVYGVLIRPLPYAGAERIVAIGDKSSTGGVDNIGFATIEDVRERNSTFEFLTAVRSWAPTLVADRAAERLTGMRVSWDFFAMLGVAPAWGRSFTAAEDAPNRWRVVVLSDRLWHRKFGADPGVIGRTIRLNDLNFEVVGVMPPDFQPLVSAAFYQPAEIWAPLGYDNTLSYACHTCRHLRAIGKTKPGVTSEQVAVDLHTIRTQLMIEHPTDYAPGELGAVRLADILSAPVRPALLVLLGAVALVLLVACANVANLLLARALTRSRELAVRAALGAGRARLVRQMLTESTLLGIAGGALGVAGAAMLIRSLETVAPIDIPRLGSVAIDWTVLAFAAGLAFATGTAFGIAPALRVSSIQLVDPLRADPRTLSSSNRVRHGLVIADVALALVLLTGAGLMLRTVMHLVRVDPGFDPAGVLTMQLSLAGDQYQKAPAVLSFQDRLLERVRELSDVDSVAIAGQIPMGGNWDRFGFHIEGGGARNPAENPSVERYSVTPDYFRLMRIRLLRGRLLTDQDTDSSLPVMVISETAARTIFKGRDPIGTRVRLGDGRSGPWRTIVGVVADVRHRELTEGPDTQMYLPQAQFTDGFIVLAVRARSGAPDRLLAQIRAIIRELDPGVPLYGVAPLADLVGRSFEDRRFLMQLLIAFAAVALLLAGVGLFGLVSFVVAQRTRELGVRIALGAGRAHIVRLVLRAAATSVGIGVLLGLAGVAVLTRSLDAMLVGVTPLDPISMAGAVASVAGMALVAHVTPAWRALCVDPVSALRTD